MTETAAPPPTHLCVTDLRKDYPTAAGPFRVLRGVSLTLTAGQSLAVVGPSGSGKSTLLNLVAALDEPTGGTVRLNGIDPFALSGDELAAFRRRRIGFIFQDHHLLGQCTALENLLLAPLAAGAVDDEHVKLAENLLERVGLDGRGGSLPAELSGGERQRVAVARAMMNGADLLLCDEPTGALDRRTAEAVADLLLSMARAAGSAVLVATHDEALAARLDRRHWLRDGVWAED